MQISIIIPTLNEAANIKQCIQNLQQGNMANVAEIIVVDAESSDDTFNVAKHEGATVYAIAKKSRAHQMNCGAQMAKGDVLYFVHADALPPTSYASDIKNAIEEGYSIGRFRFLFDSKKFMLKINSWFTRLDKLWVSGGDETLFVTQKLFAELGGYNEAFTIMEEYDFVVRARKNNKYKVIQKDVLVSARKYENNSWFKVQKANFKAFKMFKQRADPAKIKAEYYRMISHPKDV